MTAINHDLLNRLHDALAVLNLLSIEATTKGDREAIAEIDRLTVLVLDAIEKARS